MEIITYGLHYQMARCKTHNGILNLGGAIVGGTCFLSRKNRGMGYILQVINKGCVGKEANHQTLVIEYVHKDLFHYIFQ